MIRGYTKKIGDRVGYVVIFPAPVGKVVVKRTYKTKRNAERGLQQFLSECHYVPLDPAKVTRDILLSNVHYYMHDMGYHIWAGDPEMFEDLKDNWKLACHLTVNAARHRYDAYEWTSIGGDEETDDLKWLIAQYPGADGIHL
tara:strand:- start:44 stop:469 length:426 start_codon:yes stop_codon:yes gene_type:complete